MQTQVQLTQTYTIQATGCCGHVFGMSPDLYRHVWVNGNAFFCPRCGSRRTPGKSEVDTLKKQVEDLERQKQWARDDAAFERKEKERTQHQLAAVKGHQTRLKKRIAAGVCPCCNRTFQDLARHMSGQHPEYAAPESNC